MQNGAAAYGGSPGGGAYGGGAYGGATGAGANGYGMPQQQGPYGGTTGAYGGPTGAAYGGVTGSYGGAAAGGGGVRASAPIKLKDCSTPELLQHLPTIQKLLGRLMQCVPEGASAVNPVILVSQRDDGLPALGGAFVCWHVDYQSVCLFVWVLVCWHVDG